jgi:hypothetical protein
MKEYIDAIESSFVDFSGKEHRFVVAAISQVLPKYTDQGEELTYEVNEYIEDYGCNDCLSTIVKVLRVGFSVCNPEDDFDFQTGKLKAVARARINTPILYASSAGVINNRVVKALLIQEAEYLKKNPELLIPGYTERKRRLELREEMLELKDNFNKLEKEVLAALQVNPKIFDNVKKYLTWKENQIKGGNKCPAEKL